MLSDAEDIEAYLTTFERMMAVYGVEEDRWAFKLAPQLTGRAQEAYAALNSTAAAVYKEVKKAILRRYGISEETYRQRFRSTRKEGEAYRELATKLKTLTTKWLGGSDSVADVIEKLVVEQLLDILPQDLRIWLCERKPTTGDQAAALADDYVLARRRRRSDVRRKETLTSASDASKRAIWQRNVPTKTPVANPQRARLNKRSHKRSLKGSPTPQSATTATRGDILQETAPAHSTATTRSSNRVVGIGARWFRGKLVGVGGEVWRKGMRWGWSQVGRRRQGEWLEKVCW